MKTAVVSAAFGPVHKVVSQISFPTFRKYAERMGSDFIVFQNRAYPRCGHHGWEKCQIRFLMDKYDAVLWIDDDAVILPNTPSIFDHVPAGAFAAREQTLHEDDLRLVSSIINVPVVPDRKFGYFNSGVFVIWRGQEWVLVDPPEKPQPISRFGEQTAFNLRVAHLALPFHHLDPMWNTFPSELKGQTPYVVHFAGHSKSNPDVVARMHRLAGGSL